MLARAALVIAAALAAQPCAAQTYPSKPIELVVPFVAGGTTDTAARMISQHLQDKWGQTVIVSNRPGGGGTIGSSLVAKAAPDGHTILVHTIAFAISAGIQKLSYDAIKDFAAITEISSIPLMLVVHPSLPATNVKELVALSKATPAGLDYASAGVGTSPHLAGEMFKTMTGANLVHVPFKGNAETTNALLGGHLKVYFGLSPSVLQHVRAGSLRVLAVTTTERMPELPDIPTIAELGHPAYEISSWQGVFVPAATPKAVVAKLSEEIVRLIKTPEVQERIRREGAYPVGTTPERFTERFKSEVAKWAKVAKDSGLTGTN